MINMFRYLLVALGLLLPVQAKAGVPCTLPFTFSNGTIADATQVNANYNALVACLNNAAAAGVNFDITTITGLTTPLSTSQGGTSVGTHTSNGILYGAGTGAVGSARCTMDVNQSISCTSSGTNLPNFNLNNTTADASPAFFTFNKSRTGGNTNNGDFLGLVQTNGFANGASQGSGRFFCQQNGASSGSNIPTRCGVVSSTAAGNLNINYNFPITNGAANSIAVSDGSGNVSWSALVPTKQYLLSGTSATYTTPTGARALHIIFCGGGGGGGAANTNGGAAGGATTFNSVNANGGSGGAVTTGGGGLGGSGGSGAASQRLTGSSGQIGSGAANQSGGGGVGIHGTGGTRSVFNTSGAAAPANTCAGGSGGSNNSTSGGGGGAGEYVELNISSPAATYTYTIGTAGNGGAAGGQNGGNGATGIVIVTEYY